MDKKKLIGRMFLVLCFVISVTLVTSPAYSKPYSNGSCKINDGGNMVVFEDGECFELEAKCDGDDLWQVVPLYEYFSPGQVIMLLLIMKENVTVFDGSLTLSLDEESSLSTSSSC